jgi:hypothetical protein
MKNDAVLGGVKINVPATLLVSAMGGRRRRERHARLQVRGDAVFVLGTLGRSGRSTCAGGAETASATPEPLRPTWVRSPRLRMETPLYRAFREAVRDGLRGAAAAPGWGAWRWRRQANGGERA